MLHCNTLLDIRQRVNEALPAPGVDRFLELPSGPMRVRMHGDNGAKLAIGVPGLSANCFTFNVLGPAVAELGRSLAAVDLRGRGRSAPGKTGSHGWASHARDVLAVADALGAQRFDFIGHSMGAFIGLSLMAIAPMRVRSLVLIDAVGVPDPRAMPPIMGAAQRLGTVYPSVDAFLALVKGIGVVPWDPFWEAHYREDLVETDGGVRQRASRDAVVEDLQYAASTDVRKLWHHAVAQTLLVRAGHPFAPGADIITAADRDAFLKVAPRAKAVEVPANHYGVMNHPHTARAVQELLT
ncbi:MAG: alpha/beta hydrolase [Myxococcales bacterium]|nr:alpha/beta hydrolase [Myxococcales bacterium]